MKQYIKNLKHYWFIGVLCLVVSLAFVFVTSWIKEDVELEGFVVETPVGLQSVHQLVWGFEEENYIKEDGAVYQAEIEKAKEALQVIVDISKSGNFWNCIDKKLLEAGETALGESDYFIVTAKSYNVLDVQVFGMDAERVETLELLVRMELLSLCEENYHVTKRQVLSEPVVLEAQRVGGGYVLTKALYQDDKEVEMGDFVKEKKNVFTFSNVVIVLSSLVLWAVIVLLLTIAQKEDEK